MPSWKSLIRFSFFQNSGAIRKNSLELNQLIEQNELTADAIPLKAAKYILVECEF